MSKEDKVVAEVAPETEAEAERELTPEDLELQALLDQLDNDENALPEPAPEPEPEIEPALADSEEATALPDEPREIVPPPPPSVPPQIVVNTSVDVQKLVEEHLKVRSAVLDNYQADRLQVEKTIQLCMDHIEVSGPNAKAAFVEGLVMSLKVKSDANNMAIRITDSTTKLMSVIKNFIPAEGVDRPATDTELQTLLDEPLDADEVGR